MKAIALALLFAGAAGAQPGPRYGAQHMRHFDPNTIQTVDGTIQQIVVREMMRMKGVHALLKTTTGETLEVHLGPQWFIDNQEAKLQQGDTVSVRGSRTTIDGQPALIAIDVKRGGDTLRLREDDGTPLWSAWRSGGGGAGPMRGPGHMRGPGAGPGARPDAGGQ